MLFFFILIYIFFNCFILSLINIISFSFKFSILLFLLASFFYLLSIILLFLTLILVIFFPSFFPIFIFFFQYSLPSLHSFRLPFLFGRSLFLQVFNLFYLIKSKHSFYMLLFSLQMFVNRCNTFTYNVRSR